MKNANETKRCLEIITSLFLLFFTSLNTQAPTSIMKSLSVRGYRGTQVRMQPFQNVLAATTRPDQAKPITSYLGLPMDELRS